MSNYRRLYAAGACYFFTLVTNGRNPILCNDQAIERLKTAFRYTIKKYPFHINSLVVLPDHLHCIWQLPAHDANFSKRWRMIKHYFSIGMAGSINERGEKNVWQRRFWEHLIRDEHDFHACLDYIYYNPVKHGYVNNPSDWAYSTFKRDVKKGLYEMDWGSDCDIKDISEIELE